MNDKQPKAPKANRFNFEDTPTFEQAEVPTYMVQLEIDTLPANRPFFIEPDDVPTWSEMPPMMVDKTSHKLHIVGSVEIETSQEHPSTPLEKVAIMRVEFLGKDEKITSFFVADLRFIENHTLPVVDALEDAPTDQEEFNNWMDGKKDLREVVAFIAPIPDTEASKKGVIPAMYYGPEEYYGALDDLRLCGDKLLAKSLKRQRRAKKLAKVTMHEQPKIEDSALGASKTEPDKGIPPVLFSNK